jgi:hypothetical protein
MLNVESNETVYARYSKMRSRFSKPDIAPPNSEQDKHHQIHLSYSVLCLASISTRQAMLLLKLILSSDAVSVTHNSSMAIPICMFVLSIWTLPIDHFAMQRNAMSILRADIALHLLRLVFSWSPSEVISSDFNVVVGKLAKLIIVHTEQLSFFRSTKVQARNIVDDQSQDCGHNEGIACGSQNVCNLDVKLLVVVIQPATVNDTCVDSVETDNVVGCEESVEEKPNHSCDTVLSEYVHAIIDTDPEFDYQMLVPRLYRGGV